MRKKLLTTIAILALTLATLAMATGCATAPSVVRNPPEDPTIAHQRLQSDGWISTLVPSILVTPAVVTATRSSHTLAEMATWDENTNTRVWSEIVTITYFSTDALASAAYTTANTTLTATQNNAPDGVTVSGGVWRNDNIISTWTRTAGRFNANS